MSSFDELRPATGRATCPRCGLTHNDGRVTIIARRADAEQSHVASKSRSFCEPCTIEVFTGLRDQLESEAQAA